MGGDDASRRASLPRVWDRELLLALPRIGPVRRGACGERGCGRGGRLEPPGAEWRRRGGEGRRGSPPPSSSCCISSRRLPGMFCDRISLRFPRGFESVEISILLIPRPLGSTRAHLADPLLPIFSSAACSSCIRMEICVLENTLPNRICQLI